MKNLLDPGGNAMVNECYEYYIVEWYLKILG